MEVMLAPQEHNNFNGVLAITSCLNSSAVHRLVSTKDRIDGHLLKALVHAGQPPGEVVEAPGPGEVKAVQVNQFSVSAVNNL